MKEKITRAFAWTLALGVVLLGICSCAQETPSEVTETTQEQTEEEGEGIAEGNVANACMMAADTYLSVSEIEAWLGKDVSELAAVESYRDAVVEFTEIATARGATRLAMFASDGTRIRVLLDTAGTDTPTESDLEGHEFAAVVSAMQPVKANSRYLGVVSNEGAVVGYCFYQCRFVATDGTTAVYYCIEVSNG